MASREQVLCEMEKTGVVAVIRASDPTQLMDVVPALKAGGVTCIEVTMTTPNALEVIAKAAKEFAGQCIIGVGTVLDAETARAAILAGAEFVVCPVFNAEVVTLCRRYSKAVIPGAFTPTEILDRLAGRRGRGEGLPRDQARPGLHQGRQGSAAAGEAHPDRRRRSQERRRLDQGRRHVHRRGLLAGSQEGPGSQELGQYREDSGGVHPAVKEARNPTAVKQG